MPLEQRIIEPTLIFRDNLPLNRNPALLNKELECMSNGSLANVIRQLSNLAFYADDIFNGILNETKRLNKKAEYLQSRIYRLAENANQLDFQQEQLSFIDLNCNELFKSSFTYDQEVVSRQTMPNLLLRKYSMCDKPPPLSILNPFREDGKDALTFYTDPNYFFNLWKNEMLKKTEKEKFSKKMISNQSLNTTKQIEESHTSKQKKVPRKAENSTEKYRKMMSQQEFFADSNQLENQQPNDFNANDYSPYGTIEIAKNRDLDSSKKLDQIDGTSFFNDQLKSTQHFRLNDTNAIFQQQQQAINQKENTNHVRFNQTPEIIPNSPIKSDQLNSNTISSAATTTVFNSTPPPPPPMPTTNLFENNNLSKNLSNGGIAKMASSTTNNTITNVQQATSLAQEILKKQQEGLRSASLNQPKKLMQFDPHSSLLASIREGITLRKVQQNKQKQVDKDDGHLKDVASILARRVAMQLSDSESNHSNNNESDDDWANEN